MFKFIWLIMIILILATFGAYTAYCCIQESKDSTSLENWWDNMNTYHDILVMVWTIILIVAAVILFASSFAAFASSFE